MTLFPCLICGNGLRNYAGNRYMYLGQHNMTQSTMWKAIGHLKLWLSEVTGQCHTIASLGTCPFALRGISKINV